MIDYIRDNFRKLFEIFIWIEIIGLTLFGLIIGGILAGIIGIFLGGIIGLLFGMMFVIIGGGIIATFLNMDENLSNLVSDISILKRNTSEIKDTLNNYIKTISNTDKNSSTDKKEEIIIQDINNSNGIIIKKAFLAEENSYIAKRIKNLDVNEEIKIISTKNHWFFVECNDNAKGYVHSEYVKVI